MHVGDAERRRRYGRVTAAAGTGSAACGPCGQTASLLLIADRDDLGARAQREHREAVLRLLERARRAARALREDEQDVALLEDPRREPEGLDVRGVAVDRVDAAVRRHPAEDRPVEQLLLAQPVDPAADGRRQPRRRRRTSAFEMWLTARITAPVRGMSRAPRPDVGHDRAPTRMPARPSASIRRLSLGRSRDRRSGAASARRGAPARPRRPRSASASLDRATTSRPSPRTRCRRSR